MYMTSLGGGGGAGGSRMMSPKQLLTVAIVIFSTLSFIKLLLLTGSSSGGPRSPAWDAGGGNGTGRGALAAKELALLRSVVAARAPCRLLVFGISPQLLALARLNSGAGGGAGPAAATTAFVTDSAEDAAAARQVLGSWRGGARADPAVAVHRARYRDAAAEAWPLLRRARGSPACRRLTGAVRRSRCPLALTSLPREVLDARWDVVVVDGPSGAAPEEPGRMGAIYTAAALARAAAEAAGGAAVDVALHDVDRTIERWYAWEYLCEDNLVAAKGRLWHFRVGAGGPPDAFCNIGPVQIL